MSRFKELASLDEKITLRLGVAESHPVLRIVLGVVSHSADSWYWLFALAILWLVGGPQQKLTAILWGFGIVILAAAVLGVKFLTRRPRPEGEWGQVYRVTDPHSFPSGHAARAAALAVMVAQFSLPWLTAMVIVWALLVGYSRIALKLHYFSDVLVGWLIGGASGAVALAFFPWLQAAFPRIFEILT